MHLLQHVLLISILCPALSSRVLELSDKFVEIAHEGQWFVKFYAPWCAHCRRMEPTWAHVAQMLSSSPIKIAKVDCQRFPDVAKHFNVRMFPVILFIKGGSHYEYGGERQKEDMVSFALRMSDPPVQTVTSDYSLDILKEGHPVFYAYVGNREDQLWELFNSLAEKYQPHCWFYAVTHEMIHPEIIPPNENAIFVYKDGEALFFEADFSDSNQLESINNTLDKWINAERFGLFPKVTQTNLEHLMSTSKYLVIAVVNENKLNEISQTERDFKDMIEDIIRSKKRDLHNRYQFGWMGSIELANSIAMTELTVPHLLVLNSTTNHHHLPSDDPTLMTPEAVVRFLNEVHLDIAPRYGGNSWPVHAYRGFYELRATLAGMWRGNPILTVLVFGLPMGFLSLICYSVCCADILDAPEDEEEELEPVHEKED